MLSAADLLTTIAEEKLSNIKDLAKKLEISRETLQATIMDLQKHNLVEYDPKTGKVNLPKWLTQINRRMETAKPAAGEIILPKYQEIKIQDLIIGNYTKTDLELKIRLKAKQKEIAICTIT